ncbi:MAG: Peptidase, M23 family [candidate division TM6 bacterium GW2011_GWF2_32_72]|nr:MAG: Peptidase, M23 family [candidate division TM6 bacterium GW2011_GWF2_32_72]
MNKLGKFLIIFFSLIASILAYILFEEYCFFREQSDKMIELKVQYKDYLRAFKNILEDYDRVKERLKELEESKQKTADGLESLKVEQPLPPSNQELSSKPDELVQHIVQPTKQVKKKVSSQNSVSSIGRFLRGKRHVANRDALFSWPIDTSKFWISSLFGPRRLKNKKWGFHRGVDMSAMRGTPVLAAASGTIVEAGWAKGFGKTIVVAHNQKYKTRYAHLDKILVRKGQVVKRGTCIGKVGDTGFVVKSGQDASHLHFEVSVDGKKVNPLYLLV